MVIKRKPPTKTYRRGKYGLDYYDREGKRKRPSFDTKAERDRAFDKLMKARDEGKELSSDPMDIKAAVKRYYDTYSVKKSYCPTEKKNFERLVDYLCGDEGLVFLDEIRPMHMESYQELRSTQVDATATVNREFTSYRAFFTWCVRMELLEKSPVKPVLNLVEDSEEREVWTLEEFKQIREMLKPEAQFALDFIYYTGARPSELMRLTWKDVDLKEGTAILTHFKGRVKKRQRREVPLHPSILAKCEAKFEAARKIFRAKPEDPVVRGRFGGPMQVRSLSQAVLRIREKLGVKGNKVPYGLRHTIATEMAKVDLEATRKLLGHAKLSTTQKYLHYDNAHVRSVVERRSE